MKLSDIQLDSHNANKGTARGQKQLVGSIQRNGFGRSGLLDKNGIAIAGNKTTEAAVEVFGIEVEPIIIQTDGKRPVYVQRTDLDLNDTTPNNPARRLAYEDNLISYFSFEMNPEIVMADIEARFDFEAIDISLPDLGKLLQQEIDPLTEWQGMPEFENDENLGAIASVKVHFASQKAIEKFSQLMEQTVSEKTKFIWFPEQPPENLKVYRAIDES